MFVDQDEDIENFKISLAGEYKSFLKYNSINCKMQKETITNKDLNSTKSGHSYANQGINKENNIRNFIEHNLGLQTYSSANIDAKRKMSVYKLIASIPKKHKFNFDFQQPDVIQYYKHDDPEENISQLKQFHTSIYEYSYSIIKNSNSQPEEYNLKVTKILIIENKNKNEKDSKNNHEIFIKSGCSYNFDDAGFEFFSDEKKLKIHIYRREYGKIKY